MVGSSRYTVGWCRVGLSTKQVTRLLETCLWWALRLPGGAVSPPPSTFPGKEGGREKGWRLPQGWGPLPSRPPAPCHDWLLCGIRMYRLYLFLKGINCNKCCGEALVVLPCCRPLRPHAVTRQRGGGGGRCCVVTPSAGAAWRALLTPLRSPAPRGRFGGGAGAGARARRGGCEASAARGRAAGTGRARGGGGGGGGAAGPAAAASVRGAGPAPPRPCWGAAAPTEPA